MDGSSQLRVLADWEQGLVTLTLEGELDVTSAPQAQQSLAAVLARNPARLVMDLAGLSFMDSQGLELLIRACRGLQDGREVIIRDANPSVRRMLALTGIDQVCVIEGQELPPLPGTTNAPGS